MFQNKGNRYLTKSVQAIPLSIQLALLQLIDVSVEQGLNQTIWVIDDVPHQTMLLPKDY